MLNIARIPSSSLVRAKPMIHGRIQIQSSLFCCHLERRMLPELPLETEKRIYEV
jgi:hypothetical protein